MNRITIMFLTSILMFFSCGAGNRVDKSRQKPTEPLKSYHYIESGSMAQPDLEFTIEYMDDSLCRVIYFNRLRDDYKDMEERDTVTAPASLLKEIEKIVSEHKMYKYEKNYSSKWEVMDGTSWGMYLTYQDDRSISSHGYMSWPQDDGISIITNLMRKRFKGL